MSRRASIDDLTAAIEWLGCYEGGADDKDDPMRAALVATAEYLGREVARRYSAGVVRGVESGLRERGRTLTPEGWEAVRERARTSGDQFADDVLRTVYNATAGPLRR